MPRNWSPQSHLSEPKRSPVRQAECRRTGTTEAEVGLADNDGDLIAQAFSTAEDDEFGFRRMFKRHRGAADNMQISGLMGAELAQGLGLDAEDILHWTSGLHHDDSRNGQ